LVSRLADVAEYRVGADQILAGRRKVDRQRTLDIVGASRIQAVEVADPGCPLPRAAKRSKRLDHLDELGVGQVMCETSFLSGIAPFLEIHAVALHSRRRVQEIVAHDVDEQLLEPVGLLEGPGVPLDLLGGHALAMLAAQQAAAAQEDAEHAHQPQEPVRQTEPGDVLALDAPAPWGRPR
jgi:hypothetical protein